MVESVTFLQWQISMSAPCRSIWIDFIEKQYQFQRWSHGEPASTPVPDPGGPRHETECQVQVIDFHGNSSGVAYDGTMRPGWAWQIAINAGASKGRRRQMG
jgi:hypothetical protein